MPPVFDEMDCFSDHTQTPGRQAPRSSSGLNPPRRPKVFQIKFYGDPKTARPLLPEDQQPNPAAALPGKNAKNNLRQRRNRQLRKAKLAAEQVNQLAAEEPNPASQAAEEPNPASQAAEEPNPASQAAEEPGWASIAAEEEFVNKKAILALQARKDALFEALLAGEKPALQEFVDGKASLALRAREEELFEALLTRKKQPRGRYKMPSQTAFEKAVQNEFLAAKFMRDFAQQEPNQASIAAEEPPEVKKEPNPVSLDGEEPHRVARERCNAPNPNSFADAVKKEPSQAPPEVKKEPSQVPPEVKKEPSQAPPEVKNKFPVAKWVRGQSRQDNSPEAKAARAANEALIAAKNARDAFEAAEAKRRKEESERRAADMVEQRRKLVAGIQEGAASALESDQVGQIISLLDLLESTKALTLSFLASDPDLTGDLKTLLDRTGNFSSLDWENLMGKLIKDDKLTMAGKGACRLHNALWFEKNPLSPEKNHLIPEIQRLSEFVERYDSGPVSQEEIDQAKLTDALTRHGTWGANSNKGADQGKALESVENMRKILNDQIAQLLFEADDAATNLKFVRDLLARAEVLILRVTASPDHSPLDIITKERVAPVGFRRDQFEKFSELVYDYGSFERRNKIRQLGLEEVAAAAERILDKWDMTQALNLLQMEDFLNFAKGVFSLLVSIGGIDADHMLEVKSFFGEIISRVMSALEVSNPTRQYTIEEIHDIYAPRAPAGCVLLRPNITFVMFSKIDPSLLGFLVSVEKTPQNVQNVAPPDAVSAVILQPISAVNVPGGPTSMEALKEAVVNHFSGFERPPTKLTEARRRWVGNVQELRTVAGTAGGCITEVKNAHGIFDTETLQRLKEDLGFMHARLSDSMPGLQKQLNSASEALKRAQDNLAQISELTPEQQEVIRNYAKSQEEARRADSALKAKNDTDAAMLKAVKDRKANDLSAAVLFFEELCKSLTPDFTLLRAFSRTCDNFRHLSTSDIRSEILLGEIGEMIAKKPSTQQQWAIANAANFAKSLTAGAPSGIPFWVESAFKPPQKSESDRFAKELTSGEAARLIKLLMALIRFYGFVPSKDGNTPEGFLQYLETLGVSFTESDKFETPGLYKVGVCALSDFLVAHLGQLPINHLRDTGDDVKYRIMTVPIMRGNSAAGEFKDQGSEVTPEIIGCLIGEAKAYQSSVEENARSTSIPGGFYRLMQKLADELAPKFKPEVPANWATLLEIYRGSNIPDAELSGPRAGLREALEEVKRPGDPAGPKKRVSNVSAKQAKQLESMATRALEYDIRKFAEELEAKHPGAKTLLHLIENYQSARARARLEHECNSQADQFYRARRDALVRKLDYYLRTGCKLPELRSLGESLPAVNTKVVDSMSEETRATWVATQIETILGGAGPATPESLRLGQIKAFADLINDPSGLALIWALTGGDSGNLVKAAELLAKNSPLYRLGSDCERLNIPPVPVMFLLGIVPANTLDALVQSLVGMPANALAGMIRDKGTVGSSVGRLVNQAFAEVRCNMDLGATNAAIAYFAGALRDPFANSLPVRLKKRFESFFSSLARAYGLDPREYKAKASVIFASMPLLIALSRQDHLSRLVMLLTNAAGKDVDINIAVFNSYRDSAVLDSLNLIIDIYKAAHQVVPARVLDMSDPRDAAELFARCQDEKYGLFIGDAFTRAGRLMPAIMRSFTYVGFIGHNFTDCTDMLQLRASMDSKQPIMNPDGSAIKWNGKKNAEGKEIAWTTISQQATCRALWTAQIGRREDILHLQPLSNQYTQYWIPGEEAPPREWNTRFREFHIAPPLSKQSILTFPETDKSYAASDSKENWLEVR